MTIIFFIPPTNEIEAGLCWKWARRSKLFNPGSPYANWSTGLQDVQQGYLSTNVQCEANKNEGRAKLLDLLLLLVTTKTLCFYKGSTWGLFVVCRSIMWRTLWQFCVPACPSVQFVVCLLVCLFGWLFAICCLMRMEGSAYQSGMWVRLYRASLWLNRRWKR